MHITTEQSKMNILSSPVLMTRISNNQGETNLAVLIAFPPKCLSIGTLKLLHSPISMSVSTTGKGVLFTPLLKQCPITRMLLSNQNAAA